MATKRRSPPVEPPVHIPTAIFPDDTFSYNRLGSAPRWGGFVTGSRDRSRQCSRYSSFQPELRLEQTAAGVVIAWEWPRENRFVDLLEIQVDREIGAGFVLIGSDIRAHSVDTHPITLAARWTYRAIFRLRDARVGRSSEPVSLHVAP